MLRCAAAQAIAAEMLRVITDPADQRAVVAAATWE
jgi:hypothetical protein